MRRLLVLLLALVFAIGGMTAVYAGIAPGPAPNSGDGISDGSGFDDPPPGPLGDGDPLGPAPNAGDGDPDGSGLDAPYAPI